MAALVAASALLFTSCAGPGGEGPRLPLAVSVGYQIPDTDVVLVLSPSAKSATGYSLDVRGTYKGLEQTATGWRLTRPNGFIYEIDTTTSPPTLAIIGTGEAELGNSGVVILPQPPKTLTVVEPAK